jgi:hypothetical protein
MKELREITQTIEVPTNTGVEGFLHVMREVLRLPRIQRIAIESNGKFTFTRLQRPDVENNLNVSFDHLSPYYVIRNSEMKEMNYPESMSSLAVVANMLDAVGTKGFSPTAFIVSTQTTLWSWLRFSDAVSLSDQDALLGYPVFHDQKIPDTVLVLCASLDRSTSLIDTKFSIKVEMRKRASILDEEIEIR